MSARKSRKTFFLVAFAVFLVAFGLSAARTFIIPKQYASTVKIEIAGLAGRLDAPATLQAQAKILGTDALLSKVSDRLNLETVWGKKIKLDGIMNTWETVMLMKRQMEVIPDPAAGTLLVRFYDDDKVEAAQVANEIARIYCLVSGDAGSGIKAVVRERAVISEHPAHPNIPLRLLFGGIAALVFAIGVAGLVTWIQAGLKQAAPQPIVATAA